CHVGVIDKGQTPSAQGGRVFDLSQRRSIKCAIVRERIGLPPESAIGTAVTLKVKIHKDDIGLVVIGCNVPITTSARQGRGDQVNVRLKILMVRTGVTRDGE